MTRLSVLAVLVLAACSDATGPSSDPLRPDFANVCAGGEDAHGCAVGGNGGSGASACEWPNHMSGDCVHKGIETAAGYLGAVGICTKNPWSYACSAIATANAGQWYDFWHTADADGHTHSARPGELDPGRLYPIGGPSW